MNEPTAHPLLSEDFIRTVQEILAVQRNGRYVPVHG